MNDHSAENRRPHMLLAWRSVRHFYAEVAEGSVTARKMSSSLGYQMQQSVNDLMQEFREDGRDYVLSLEGGCFGDKLHRWHLYVNGEHLATIDKDYGYDCFDVSATCFKDTIAMLIELSDVEPLSKTERELLDAQTRVNRIVEHHSSGQA